MRLRLLPPVRHTVAVALTAAALLAGCRCAPVVLEADPCHDDAQAAAGITLGEPSFAPLPATPAHLPYFALLPAVATDGTGYLVTWSAAGQLIAARLDAAGAVVTRKPLSLGSAAPITAPTTVFTGVHYLVTWSSVDGGVLATRVTPEGEVLDPGGAHLQGAPAEAGLSLAASGGRTLAAWLDSASTLKVAELTGTTLGPAEAHALPGGPAHLVTSTFATDGTTWALLTSRAATDGGSTVVAQFFRWAPFAYLGEVPLPNAETFSGIDLAGGAGQFLAAWSAADPTEHIWAQRLTPAGLEGGAFPVTITGRRHRAPDVEFDGTTFQVAWQGWAAGADGQDIFSTSVSTTGAVAAPSGAPVAARRPASNEHLQGVALAAAAGRTLAVYTANFDDERVAAAFLSPDAGGTPLPWPVSLTDVFRVRPRVVATPSGYVVLWQENLFDGARLAAARLGPDGALLQLVPLPPASDGGPAGLVAATAEGERVVAVQPGGWLRASGVATLEPGGSAFQSHPDVALGGLTSMMQVASSATTTLLLWSDLYGRWLWARPLLAPVDGGPGPDASLLPEALPMGAIEATALGTSDGGFSATCVEGSAVHFLALDDQGALLGRSAVDGGPGGREPMLRLERGGLPVALFQRDGADGGLLAAVREDGLASTPAALGDTSLLWRFAHARLGAEDLVGWFARVDGGVAPLGVRLGEGLEAAGGGPFTWALDASVGDFDLAGRGPTEALLVYTVVDEGLSSTVAWRRVTVGDARTCPK